MKKLNRAIDRFCYNHPRFGINRLMLYVVIGTALFYLISIMDRSGAFWSFVSFSPAAILRGEVWRLITWIFYPLDSRPLYLILSLYFYYFIGSTLENQWGSARFTIYYLIGVVLNIIYGFVVYLISNQQLFITASYLNLSMFFAFAAMFPEERVLLLFIIPIKMKWLAIVDAVFFAISFITNIIGGAYLLAFLPIVAILNFFIFCGGYLSYSFKRSRVSNINNTINFKSAAKKAEREQSKQPYRHKCAVCGKTDTDYPTMQFRYCSRCTGYHCFCEEHINSHIHFTE